MKLEFKRTKIKRKNSTETQVDFKFNVSSKLLIALLCLML